MFHRLPRLVWLVALLGLSACSTGNHAPMSVISNFDESRYLGTWHQVAAIPAWFQEDCVGNVTATYALDDDGRISVLNACDRADNSRDEADGKARFTGPRDEGRLEVSFVSVLGGWLWLAGGDYWIIGLSADGSQDYAWSLVGEPGRKFAWILARQRELDTTTLQNISGILRDNAYDPCQLIMTTPTHSGPLCELGDQGDQ